MHRTNNNTNRINNNKNAINNIKTINTNTTTTTTTTTTTNDDNTNSHNETPPGLGLSRTGKFHTNNLRHKHTQLELWNSSQAT